MDTVALDVIDLPIENMKCEGCIERVRSALEELPGVENVEVQIGKARVVFYPQMASPGVFRERLAHLGYPGPTTESSNKGIFGRWMDRIVASNQSAFGTRSLDCCKLNRKKPG